MAESKPRVLLVEDTRSLAVVYEQYLVQDGYEVLLADCGQQALAQLLASPPPVVLLDLELPDMSGMAILQQITEQQLPCSVVVITAHGSVDVAVEAMRCGAFDFLTKPFDSKLLFEKVQQALRVSPVSSHPTGGNDGGWLDGMVFRSRCMAELMEEARVVAATDASVLIRGESGSGKEVLARAIHRASPRSKAPFVAINCGAIPEQLLESELFGHVRGAFTGATSEHGGLFKAADGGTLFLDEIGELPLPLQTKLLRALEERRIRRNGEIETAKRRRLAPGDIIEIEGLGSYEVTRD